MKRRDLDPELVRQMYVDRDMTIEEIAAAMNSGDAIVRRALSQANVSMRPFGPREHKKTKPHLPFVLDGQGYRLVMRPDHPKASAKGYIQQHVLVMEQKLGRRLVGKEEVHHDDENKGNNHPDNLILMKSRGDHIRHHNLQKSSCKFLRQLPRDDLVELYSRLSTVRIASQYGTSPASVQRLLAERGVTKCRGRRAGVPETKPRKPRRSSRSSSTPDAAES